MAFLLHRTPFFSPSVYRCAPSERARECAAQARAALPPAGDSDPRQVASMSAACLVRSPAPGGPPTRTACGVPACPPVRTHPAHVRPSVRAVGPTASTSSDCVCVSRCTGASPPVECELRGLRDLLRGRLCHFLNATRWRTRRPGGIARPPGLIPPGRRLSVKSIQGIRRA